MSGRSLAIANLFPALVVAALIVIRLAQAAPVADNAAVAAVADNAVAEPPLVPALAADASVVEKLQPIAFGRDEVEPAVDTAADVTSAVSAPSGGAVSAPAQDAAPVVQLAMADPTEKLPPGEPPEQVAKGAADDEQKAGAAGGIDSVEVLDECFAVDTCIDRYLWALYQRTPKEDTVAEQEERQVTVKKRGKLVTVTKSFTTHVNEEFSWKDRKAAEHVNMSLMDYVFGGVDPAFKRRLFNMLFAAEKAGLSPGITSAFRDDYRQSIATGLKAANDRSYHGGSSRGGYGHGLAADVVSVKGDTRAQRRVSTEAFWKWVDAHGQEFGIGRPYLDHDPPHVGPIDGKEYIAHRGAKVREASRETPKSHDRKTAHNHRMVKRIRTARS